MANTKYTLEKIKIEGALKDLITKSNGDNVTVTYNGTEKTLAAALTDIATDIGGKASGADLTTVSGKITTLLGGSGEPDKDKSIRAIAGEVLAAAGKLERKIVASTSAIDTATDDAETYIYMVPKSVEGANSKYDEYMVIDGKVEKVGDWEVDLSNYIQKISSAAENNIVAFDGTGGIKDSGKAVGGEALSSTPDADTLATEKAVSDALSNKADKVTAAVAGNLAAFVSGGGMRDSGKTVGGEALASTPDASTLATEKAVSDALSGKAGTDVATTTANGLMSSADKTRLDGIRGVRCGTEAPADMQDGELFVRVVSE